MPKNKPTQLTEFDPAEYLDSIEVIAEYLTQMSQENDQLFFAALGDIARAVGMGKIAELTGNERSGLYRALTDQSTNTKYTTICRVLKALGLRIEIKPMNAA